MARLQLLIEGVAFQNSLLILILNMVKLKDKDVLQFGNKCKFSRQRNTLETIVKK